MDNQPFDSEWIDRYVRNELSSEEEAELETALLDSPELQDLLETTLAVREALRLDDEKASAQQGQPPEAAMGRNNWQPLALAASVLLAVFSTTMLWKVSNDAASFREQVDLLKIPRSNVLTVPVNVMRSANSQSPDVIVQKPDDHSAILLDIELGPRAREQKTLALALTDASGAPVISWSATPTSDGRTRVLLNSEQVPATLLWLQISSGDGQSLERRLLEFR